MSKKPPSLSRRGFFAGAASVSAVAVGAVVIPAVRPDESAVEQVKAKPTHGGGYSLSEHVKRYYKTTLV